MLTVTPHNPDYEPWLLVRAHRGDAQAFGRLYLSTKNWALAVARSCDTTGHNAEDIVSEAFASIWHAIRNGSGPREHFRAYLATTIRRLGNTYRSGAARVENPVGGTEYFDQTASPNKNSPHGEEETLRRAFLCLPTSWRVILWRIDVEGFTAAETALDVGMSVPAVNSAAYRARSRLCESYLAQHAGVGLNIDCQRIRPLLAAQVRGRPTPKDELVKRHVRNCQECAQVLAKLRGMDRHLRVSRPANRTDTRQPNRSGPRSR